MLRIGSRWRGGRRRRGRILARTVEESAHPIIQLRINRAAQPGGFEIASDVERHCPTVTFQQELPILALIDQRGQPHQTGKENIMCSHIPGERRVLILARELVEMLLSQRLAIEDETPGPIRHFGNMRLFLVCHARQAGEEGFQGGEGRVHGGQFLSGEHDIDAVREHNSGTLRLH